MRLITIFELAAFGDRELAQLHQTIAQEATRTEPGSQAHRNAAASLENIARVRRGRALGPRR